MGKFVAIMMFSTLMIQQALALDYFITYRHYDASAHYVNSVTLGRGNYLLIRVAGAAATFSVLLPRGINKTLEHSRISAADVFVCTEWASETECRSYNVFSAQEIFEQLKCQILPARYYWGFVSSVDPRPLSGLEEIRQIALGILIQAGESKDVYNALAGAELITNRSCGDGRACVNRRDVKYGMSKIYLHPRTFNSDMDLAQALIHEAFHLTGLHNECETDRRVKNILDLAQIPMYGTAYTNLCFGGFDGSLSEIGRMRGEASRGKHGVCNLNQIYSLIPLER